MQNTFVTVVLARLRLGPAGLDASDATTHTPRPMMTLARSKPMQPTSFPTASLTDACSRVVLALWTDSACAVARPSVCSLAEQAVLCCVFDAGTVESTDESGENASNDRY